MAATTVEFLEPQKGVGPHGVGDPNDKSLRKVEREVLIPKIMRERAKVEKCPEIVKEFEKCCKASSLLMAFQCRDENAKLKECLSFWYKDEGFQQECTKIYLDERTEYRETGIKRKYRK